MIDKINCPFHSEDIIAPLKNKPTNLKYDDIDYRDRVKKLEKEGFHLGDLNWEDWQFYCDSQEPENESKTGVWFKLTDKLPPKEKEVLAYCNYINENYGIGYFHDGCEGKEWVEKPWFCTENKSFQISENFQPTHWMIPKSPEN
jgi:hypothetical protein